MQLSIAGLDVDCRSTRRDWDHDRCDASKAITPKVGGLRRTLPPERPRMSVLAPRATVAMRRFRRYRGADIAPTVEIGRS
jgi:hypothetical protein